MIGKVAAVLRGGAVPLGASILSLLLGLLVPIYTDETGWRFQERAAIDGVDSLYTDLCGPVTLARPPWFMMPVRAFSALANEAFATPFFIRLEGVLCALAWLALLWLFTGQLPVPPERRARLRMLGFSLLGLGVLPFVLVMSRPEQPLILATTAMLVVSRARLGLAERRAVWAKIAIIALLAVVALSYHLKGIVYAPVAIVAMAICATGPGTLLPRALGAAILGGLTLSAAEYWTQRLSCPASAAITAIHGRENLVASLAAGGDTWTKLLNALPGADPLTYILLTVPHDSPMSGWLPLGAVPSQFTVFFAATMLLLWLALLVLSLGVMIVFLVARGWRALLQPEFAFASTILLLVLAWGFSQLNKNVYEAGHVLPMLTLFVLLSLALPGGKLADRGLRLAAHTALPLSLLSQVLVAGLFTGPLLTAAGANGYIDAQPFSISVRNYAQVRRDIHNVVTAAHIAPDRRSHGLLLDELTYLALQDTRLPFHRLGVLPPREKQLVDPVLYLRSRHSDGVVIGCRYLPANMLAVAVRSGEICAISRQGLARARPGTP